MTNPPRRPVLPAIRLKRATLASLAVAFTLVIAAGAAPAYADTASFINPQNGAANVDTTRPFAWTSVANVQAYYLYVGTSQGAKDLVDSGETLATSWNVPPLPTGQTLWARIWTKVNGNWTYQDASFTAAPRVASLTFPTSGATNVDTSQPFTWTAIPNAQAYYLYVGTSQGAKDLVDSGETLATSWNVPPLPTGQTLWARIWTKINSTWAYQDVSFTAGARSRAAFSNPTNGAPNVDPSIPFSWYPASNPQAYYLYVGTSKGAKDLVDSGQTLSTSYQIRSALPTGQTLWARIWTEVNGSWTYQDVSFTATTPSRAILTYPTNGSASVTTQPFTWTSVAGAQAYYLYVGTSQGTNNLVDSGETSATSYSVPPLPVGQTLWARIWTHTAGGSWLYSDISFQASEAAASLTYPYAGETDVDVRKTFTWSTASDAQAYMLWLGSSPGQSDLLWSGATTATSWTSPALPIGQTIYARLYTEHNGKWDSYVDSSFMVAYSYATLSYPTSRKLSGVDMSQPFTWSPVSGATGYSLWIGTSPGANDVKGSGPITGTSYSPGPLPAGAQLWARLWTQSSGTWVYGSDIQFSPGALIIAPTRQSVSVDRTQPITWAPGAVLNGQQPTYELMLGSSRGANDLFDSGTITTTSLTVPSTAMPAGRPIYARLIVKLGDSSQRVTDNVFATNDSTISPSQMDWGTAGSSTVDVSKPFAWTPSDLAQAYRFEVLDSTSTTVVDSGAIQVPRYFAENLAPGTYTAKLGTELNGSWLWTTSAFTVTNTGTNATNEIDAAHWATDYVRHMADLHGVAYAWTALGTEGSALGVNCYDYAVTLATILHQMNIAGQQTAAHQPTVVNTSFITNGNDVHTMVQFWNSADSDWIVLDPTFDLAMQRASDGHWATLNDANAATLSKSWSAINYVALGDFGTNIAKSYYLDYPLLFLNLPPLTAGSGADPTPYLSLLGTWPTNQPGAYIARSSQSSVTLVVDGQNRTFQTNSVGGYASAFWASTVSLPPGSTQSVSLYEADRSVF